MKLLKLLKRLAFGLLGAVMAVLVTATDVYKRQVQNTTRMTDVMIHFFFFIPERLSLMRDMQRYEKTRYASAAGRYNCTRSW